MAYILRYLYNLICGSILLSNSYSYATSNQQDVSNTQRINSYAGLGDSYATGAGAGSLIRWPPRNLACGRFSAAYPVQLATKLGLSGVDFKNLACGGTSSSIVRQKQIPNIGDADLITVTVGGNEVNFFPVVNECILQWRPVSTCEAELSKARSAIQSSRFINDFEEMVKAGVTTMQPRSKLMITGYARFFNDESGQCDHVSFSKTNATNFLSRSLRKEFNQLIFMLNNVIEAVAEEHGATYIDIDKVFEGHRFCEPGVSEPAPYRRETWFFNDWFDGYIDDIASLIKQYEELDHKGDVEEQYFKFQSFHPTDRGLEAIANAIYQLVQ